MVLSHLFISNILISFFQVRLVNGGEHYGKLEIYHEGSWWAINPEGISGKDTKLCVTLPFFINFRCQIENQVSDYRLLGASSFLFLFLLL
jgi:hypothetical protein